MNESQQEKLSHTDSRDFLMITKVVSGHFDSCFKNNLKHNFNLHNRQKTFPALILIKRYTKTLIFKINFLGNSAFCIH